VEKRVRAGCVGSAGAGAELRGSASAAPPCRGGYRCAPASSTGEPGARTRGHTGWTLLYWLHKIKDPTVDYSKLTDYSMLTGWPSSKGRSRTSRSCRWSARWCCLILPNGLAHVRSRARATQTLPDAAAPRSHFLRGYSAVCPCPCARGRGQHNGKVRSIDTVKSRMLAHRTPTWTLLVCFPLRGGRVGGGFGCAVGIRLPSRLAALVLQAMSNLANGAKEGAKQLACETHWSNKTVTFICVRNLALQ